MISLPILSNLIGCWRFAALSAVLSAALTAIPAGYFCYNAGYGSAMDDVEAAKSDLRTCEKREADQALALERNNREQAQAAAFAADLAHSYEYNRRQIAEAKSNALKAEVKQLKNRDCLPADLVDRLREHPAFGLPSGAAIAVAQTSAATDADLWQFAIDAADRYDECKGYIDSIRLWDKATYGSR